MENLKAFFGFSNSDDAAKARCREYLIEAVKYGRTLNPVPSFIAEFEEYLATTSTAEKPIKAATNGSTGTSTSNDNGNEPTTESPVETATESAAVDSDDPFWTKWDDYKENALNLLTGKPENHGVTPDGQFVTMWQHLEHGRLPHSTAPPEAQNRRRSSLARVRLA